ncbi:ABC transporter permease [Arthrobacter sp. AZCC_0090]|uniref:ABC transporter permease n=1 Tax=Arthrobacter sp. AZCC_0090 TaxID=2735881 RepID=UPI00160D4FAA|nr:ABC transporter permease [Arthrobacter sp. AZCC_0090]MBB6404517.1 NitT/TauT family transport system permease protein [Arthrobacter sp. AZCC_0090]
MTTLTHHETRKSEKPVETETAAKNAGRSKARRRTTSIWIGRVALAFIVVGGWQWFTEQGWVDKFFFGQPSQIWDSLVKLFTEGTAFGTIWENLGVTAQEALLGFVLGTLVGVVLGILLGSNKYLSAVVGPYIRIVNSIPRIVLGSIFIVAFGLGVFPKILLAAVLVFFVVFFNAFQGVREVDQNLVANVRVLGASPFQVAMHVTIPSAMTWIIASLHTAFGFAIIGALVAEVLGAQKGIGLIISQAQGTFDPDTVFACMVIIAVITLAAEFLIGLLEHKLLKWRPPNRSEAQSI